MPLPHANITPIPDTEPDATPELWNERYAEIDENFAALQLEKASLASPEFTGAPTVPTAAADTETAQAASTEFVIGQASDAVPAANSGNGSAGVSKKFSRGDHSHPGAFSGALVYLSADTASLVAPTPVQWASEQYDDGGWASQADATARTRLTVPANVSRVRVKTSIVWDNTGGGYRSVTIEWHDSAGNAKAYPFSNWTVAHAGIDAAAAYNGKLAINVETPVIQVAAGDYFRIIADSSASSCEVMAGSWASIERVV